jgi:hypothetical protein
MYYIYLFKSIPDSKNCTVVCFDKSFNTIDKAKRTLYKEGKGYIIKYPSSKPIFTNALEG